MIAHGKRLKRSALLGRFHTLLEQRRWPSSNAGGPASTSMNEAAAAAAAAAAARRAAHVLFPLFPLLLLLLLLTIILITNEKGSE